MHCTARQQVLVRRLLVAVLDGVEDADGGGDGERAAEHGIVWRGECGDLTRLITVAHSDPVNGWGPSSFI